MVKLQINIVLCKNDCLCCYIANTKCLLLWCGLMPIKYRLDVKSNGSMALRISEDVYNYINFVGAGQGVCDI